MKADDYSDLICIHRKVFNCAGTAGNGIQVQIYYKFNHEQNNILVEDYSIQFIINGVAGLNVADDPDLIDDDMYQQMFKAVYYELINNVILKK
jgi:hypothetical protein|tara:strand:- start:1498 stop:1776 length:279 start_codon:yes stop_codon:yes gene_type:complete